MTETQRSSPTVSVVMPTYNRAHLLPPVIASILDQDFVDFELVIIDDGSTDNTAEVVKEIQARDSRLRYVALPQNQGLGYARDEGLRYVSGRYIALADSDDLWLPGRLKIQIDILQKHPEIDVLFGDFLNIDHLRGTQALVLVEGQKGLELVATRYVEDDLFMVNSGLEIGILRSNFIAAPTMVLRKEVFDQVGGFNRTLASTDIEFCWRAAVMGAQYAYVNRPLIERHKRADSMTAQGDQMDLQRLRAVEIMYRTCQEVGRHDLLQYIRETEIRTHCNLIRIYGESGQRIRAIRAFRTSLQCGFSVRTLFFVAVAVLGPRAIDFVIGIRSKQKFGFGGGAG